jgi:hypothetical protein
VDTTVTAAPFSPGVKFDTTPGVLVKLVGGGLLGAADVQLHSSEAGAGATLEGGAAAAELVDDSHGL